MWKSNQSGEWAQGILAQQCRSQQGSLRRLSPEKWNQTAAVPLTFHGASSQVQCCSTLWLKSDSLNSSQLSLQGSNIKPRMQRSFYFKRRTGHKDYHHQPSFPLLHVLLPHFSLKRWRCFFNSHTVLQCFNQRNVKEGNLSEESSARLIFASGLFLIFSHSFPRGTSYPLLTAVFNWWELVSHSSPVLLQIVKEAYPDHTQFDQKDPHYDSTSRKENPKWSMVM